MQHAHGRFVRQIGRRLLVHNYPPTSQWPPLATLRALTSSNDDHRPPALRFLGDGRPLWSYGSARYFSDLKTPTPQQPKSSPASQIPHASATGPAQDLDRGFHAPSAPSSSAHDNQHDSLDNQAKPGSGSGPIKLEPTRFLDAETSQKLPSQHILQRSTLFSRFNSEMERILNAFAILSQRVNAYTGTDYSGISALRKSIEEHETRVDSLLDAVAAARQAHAAAVAAQAASNKEVVRLLERKNTWSDTDLERYMSLVRSEHVNEQAVQTAKDAITETERDLEEARADLEKTERKQYHEEQIWSDTIRRNSTWVTFGLMGFNIVLLLASLVVLEPWRRRRLVKEVRRALAEQSSAQAALDEAGGSVLGQAQQSLTAPTSDKATRTSAQQVEEEKSMAELPIPTSATIAASAETEVPTAFKPPLLLAAHSDTWTETFALWKAYWSDLFSERVIALRRVDLTAAALEGAAAGAAFMGLMLVLLRPR